MWHNAVARFSLLLGCVPFSPPHPILAHHQVRDLLSKDPSARLELRESPERGVHVRGLKEFVVKSAAEMAAVLEVGGGDGYCMLIAGMLCCCVASMAEV